MASLERQLRTQTQHVQLSRTERDHMREGLLEYMGYTPLVRPALHRAPARGRFVLFFRAHHFVGALAIVLMVTTGTVSVGSAASDALPGDLLYPVKVHVNEGVKTVFITGDEARIAWERERAETRLREATQLLTEGRLDNKRKEEVERRFVAHSEALVAQVRDIEETDPVLAAIASSEFEESLETHEVVLTRLADEQEQNTQENVRSITAQVHTAAQHAVEVREAAEEKIKYELSASEETMSDESTVDEQGVEQDDVLVLDEPDVSEQPVIEEGISYTAPGIRSPDMRVRTAYRAQESATMQLERAQGLLATLDDTSEMHEPARAQLVSGNTYIAEAEEALATHDYNTAYRAYRSAAVKFQKVAELLEISKLFSIEVASLAHGGNVEGDMANLEAVAAFLDVPVVNEIPSGEERDPADVRDEVQEILREVQQLLFAHEGYDEGMLDTVYRNIARAERAILRGDIYRALDDARVAVRFYTEAQKNAQATRTLLDESLYNGSLKEVPTLSPAEEVEEFVEGEPEASAVKIKHVFDASSQIHTYSGEFAVATICTDVLATLAVSESFPEQFTLVLQTSQAESCEATSTSAVFSASTTAAAEAVLVGVTLDGESLEWGLSTRPEDIQAESDDVVGAES